jgi:hypothetical protein
MRMGYGDIGGRCTSARSEHPHFQHAWTAYGLGDS